MASPQSERLALTPRTPGTTLTPTTPFTVSDSGRGVLRNPLTDEALWKRLKDAGFDKESVKRRDKAALIANIARLETQVLFFLLSLIKFFSTFCTFNNQEFNDRVVIVREMLCFYLSDYSVGVNK